MADKVFNSLQEKYVHWLGENGIGARFVFVPDKYRKENGAEREPADLVFACNGCILLMYLNKRKVKPGRDPSVILEDMDSHNLAQAKGWLKTWRRGQRLKGSNSFRTYDVAHDDYKHIVVLSVVSYDDSFLSKYHADKAQEFSVSLCSTLDDKTLGRLLPIGGSFFDIINLVLNQKKGMSINLHHVEMYVMEAVNRVDAARAWLNNESEKDVTKIQKFLKSLLNPDCEVAGQEMFTYLASILNDMPLHHHLQVVGAVKAAHDKVLNNHRTVIIHPIQFDCYCFIVTCYHMASSQLAMQHYSEIQRRLVADVRYDHGIRSVVLHFVLIPNPSFTFTYFFATPGEGEVLDSAVSKLITSNICSS